MNFFTPRKTKTKKYKKLIFAGVVDYLAINNLSKFDLHSKTECRVKPLYPSNTTTRISHHIGQHLQQWGGQLNRTRHHHG